MSSFNVYPVLEVNDTAGTSTKLFSVGNLPEYSLLREESHVTFPTCG